MQPFYLGIDLHLKRTYAVLMDQQGQVVDERRIQNVEIPEYLETVVPYESHAVLEATRNWAFLYDLLQAHVAKVSLAHPKELKAIASAAVKTDQIDAKVLAHLARLNFLPTAYAAPVEVRDLRMYTRHREWLVRRRTQPKVAACTRPAPAALRQDGCQSRGRSASADGRLLHAQTPGALSRRSF